MPSFTCPHCHRATELVELLEGAFGAFPMQRWIGCLCPGCGRAVHVHLGRSTITVGAIDGAPAPCLMPHETAPLGGVRVRWSQGGVDVTAGGRSFHVADR